MGTAGGCTGGGGRIDRRTDGGRQQGARQPGDGGGSDSGEGADGHGDLLEGCGYQ
jgi:hypothetical protein